MAVPMAVLVDSSIWSLTLRRRAPDEVHQKSLAALIAAHRVRIIGPIRQECLSGIADPNHYASVRDHLRQFLDLALERDDHELAASFFNTCRSIGIRGSHTDFVICAVADRLGLSVYTTDADFDRYALHIPIKRHAA
jgi:predicted nucleic acid-binding protein